MDDKQVLAESQSQEAVNAAANAAEAVEKARKAQADATREETTQILTDAIKDAFGEHTASGRFLDVTRVPLLCKSVLDTNAKITEIMLILKDQKIALDKKDENNAKRFVNQDQLAPVVKEIASLTDNQKWVVRTIGGIIIAAVLGLIVVNK